MATKRFFAFNTLAGCARTSTNVIENTTAGNFDSGFAKNCIRVGTSSDYAERDGGVNAFLDGSAAITEEFWLRFDINHGGSFQGSAGTAALVTVYDGANARYRIAVASATPKLQYWNTVSGAWVDVGNTSFANNSRVTAVLHVAPGGGVVEFKVGGVVLATTATATNSAPSVSKFRFGHDGGGGLPCYSQIMCANYDISDSHYTGDVANAEGTYNSDGTGVYTDANETPLNDATAILLPTSGQHRTFTKSAITLPVGTQIAGMVINGRGRIGGSILDAKLLCKQGANDGLSANKGYTASYSPRGEFYALDPATSSPFSETGYNSAEFGFQAA